MLDQLGLADELAQQCFACRETAAYNAKGEEVHGRGWSFMEGMRDTAWDFALVLRQKYQEEIFRNAMAKHGVLVEAPVELTGIKIDESVPAGQHRITASVMNTVTQTASNITCKYLVGCDGGRSSVRRMLSIPFEGATTEDRWVRIDGPIKTNLPKPRTYCSIESPTHGNVLWAALDHGATRIGYAFTAERAKAYDVFDEAAAVKEAIASVKPFDLEFENVDWWTIYSVGQRVARSFFVEDGVFLAGDACHTHSSGAAQGMNTGLHDAVNLAWKLSLVLRGVVRPDILKTYQEERLPNVQKLINYDKDISRLMTNRLPEGWEGDPAADVHEILGRLMAEAGTFSSGLGIYYELQKDNVLSVDGSFRYTNSLTAVKPGKRAPDVALLKPATFAATRLIPETPNAARFYILVFVGEAYKAECSFFDGASASSRLAGLRAADRIDYLTILSKRVPSAYEALGHAPHGRVYFDDVQHGAHDRYAVDVAQGAVVVLRPDGWIGTMAVLGESTTAELERYFERIFV
ncbi:hypothetical protein LTR36_000430 [Oleoguttula mirabilis]|uniref:FAD-binding domain-containing protein n=1 Tax=Oleoguttula mirabilis TaxID=1507867 RepID=A0AAV9JYZ7_9PEZI|nr:hypothetical protein LTR36_000430 [Oleoguttula mirabilis]